FKMCFTVDNPYSLNAFAPSLVWDLERDPADGGFLTGDEGVVITVVDPDPFIDSAPAYEAVNQFNWDYDLDDILPYGAPQVDTAINISCSLPVTLLSFSGHSTLTGNQLEWRTSYEFNSEGFEVQRSNDAFLWDNLGFVKSNAVAQEINEYGFKDSSPSNGKNFYRLKQLDIDGRFAYSSIIVLNGKATDSNKNIEVYPNPVSEGLLTIQLPAKPTIDNNIYLYNSSAQLVRQASIDNEYFYLDVHDLPPGLYVVRISEANADFYKKIIIEERE
ncbi:MAG: T9SS type A sorting domain-containing protein, partial [Saprospiraceae bacterium]